MKWLEKLFGFKPEDEKPGKSRQDNIQSAADADSYPENPEPRSEKSGRDTGAKGHVSTLRTKRNIRVFISSTFQDMQEERDVLIKKVFPKLRKICMERGVGFTEVDLRWGVTQEQAERGEVLPICLAEIENCRPYFIGLLGERYGWVPDSIPDELIDDQPWLAEHRQRSVTELEIVHGVLNNPDMADHAFFYFRDPKALGPVEQDQKSIDKQTALKDRIRQSGFPVSENYPDAEAVDQLVLKDLEQAINTEFPEQQLTPLERDRLDHEVFAESRAKVYIGRQEYFDHLDDHALGAGDPLVVLGESGSGKSALLANWCFCFREKHPNTFLLPHFIGSSTDSTDYIAMLRRIMMEIKEHYDLSNDIPDTPEELRSQFPNWLSMAAARGRFVLVLDALNQLEDKDNAPDLVWLPEFIPPEIRLIVATLPGRSLDELEKRGWPTMEVQLLEPEERQQLIKEYLLKLYAKRLPQDLVERIASQEQCANSLYLHALLEELRIFGRHAEIQSRIDHYLQANDPGKLYELILTRLEEDYEKDRPGLVGEAMTLLWAARRGLLEPELLEIMDLPPLTWSPLSLALQDSLINRSGLLTFFHDFLRQAVHAKYIKTPETEKASHLRLANYFKDRDIDQRKIDELPWQFTQAENWKGLYDLLSDLPFFYNLNINNQSEAYSYWSSVETNSALTLINAYHQVVESPNSHRGEHVWAIKSLLGNMGHSNESLLLDDYLIDYFKQNMEWENLVQALSSKANSLKIIGDWSNALKLYDMAIKTATEKVHKFSDQIKLEPLIGKAYILRELGELNAALELFREVEQRSSSSGLFPWFRLAESLLGQALIQKDCGNLDDAMLLLKKTERKSLELGDKSMLAKVYSSQATIYRRQSNLDMAMECHKLEEQICKEVGDKSQLGRSLGGQAVVLQMLGKIKDAMELHTKEERILSGVGNTSALTISFANQAVLQQKLGNWDEAFRLMKKTEKNWRELGNINGLLVTLFNQIPLLIFHLGRESEALPIAEEVNSLASQYHLDPPHPEKFKLFLDALRKEYG